MAVCALRKKKKSHFLSNLKLLWQCVSDATICFENHFKRLRNYRTKLTIFEFDESNKFENKIWHSALNISAI